MKIKANPRVLALGVVVVAVVGLLIADLVDRTTGGGQLPVTAVPQSVTSSSPTDPPATAAAGPAPSSTTTADDGDDGVADTTTATAPAVDPAATEAATAFTAAWLNTYRRTTSQWRTGLLARVDADLAAELMYADPATVPDGGRVGTVTMSHDGQLTVADVQVVSAAGPSTTLGTLHLSIVHRSAAWLISEIDWEARK